MKRIIYSYNKCGLESYVFERYINDISSESIQAIPFNHSDICPASYYATSEILEKNLFDNNSLLKKLYDALVDVIKLNNATHLLVDNANPYHFSFLDKLKIVTIYRTTDGPSVACQRDYVYSSWFDYIFYHSPAWSFGYSAQQIFSKISKSRLLFVPLGYMGKSRLDLERTRVDNQAIYIGSLHKGKIPLLGELYRNNLIQIFGKCTFKQYLYFMYCAKRFKCIKQVQYDAFVDKYLCFNQGLNLHNWGSCSFGNYRFYDYLASGTVQIVEDFPEFINYFDLPLSLFRFFDNSSDIFNFINTPPSLPISMRKEVSMFTLSKLKSSFLMQKAIDQL